jgi:uncharacterized protein
MPISLYQASVPVFLRTLTNMSAILDKAQAYADARKIDPSVLINDRLAPDMLPFSRQVQIACDTALRGGARLAGAEIVPMPDTETSFADLKARIGKTVDFLKALKPEQIDGQEERPIAMKVSGNDIPFTGQSLLLGFSLPNFFFHITMAYAILRHNGLAIGKGDYIGTP